MDNYRQASTVSSSVSVRPTASSASPSSQEPSSHDGGIPVVTVKENGKIRAYVQVALKHLHSTAAPSSSGATSDSVRSVIVRGDGQAINKTVSVVEIIKRQFAESEIEQSNELGCTNETTTYEPTMPRLDRLQTTRSIPFLAVTLAVPASVAPASRATN